MNLPSQTTHNLYQCLKATTYPLVKKKSLFSGWMVLQEAKSLSEKKYPLKQCAVILEVFIEKQVSVVKASLSNRFLSHHFYDQPNEVIGRGDCKDDDRW